jgi:hypothetical protein
MTVMVSFRSVVDPSDSDFLGHMNVSRYFAACSDGIFAIQSEMGLTANDMREGGPWRIGCDGSRGAGKRGGCHDQAIRTAYFRKIRPLPALYLTGRVSHSAGRVFREKDFSSQTAFDLARLEGSNMFMSEFIGQTSNDLGPHQNFPRF